jgi:glycosyltransferase involved in cell wall biosynthesis/methionyl-tRNA formyltransferase
MTSIAPALRVVVFTGGPQIESQVLTFLDRLEREAAVELVAVFSESPARGITGTLSDLWQRRGPLAVPLALARGVHAIGKMLCGRRQRRILRTLAARVRYVDDLHSPESLGQVRELEPDLALVYGGPIIKPALFAIATQGTLGIHHGKAPEYRGKKTTFWAMFNGEDQVGVTIQRIGSRLDGGDIVKQETVAIANRWLPAVKRHLEQVGIDLYLQAVCAVRDGTATYTPQQHHTAGAYKDPTAADIAQFWYRYLRRINQSAPITAKPRVCLLTETFHPVTGGGETQAKALAAGLANAGFSVAVVTRRSERNLPKRDFIGPVRVRRLPPSGAGASKKWLMAIAAWAALMRSARSYDVILVCGFRVLGIPAVAAGWLLRKPCILKADLLGEFSGAIFQRRLENADFTHHQTGLRWLLAARSRVLAHATRFAAVSTPVRAELALGGVSDAKIIDIPNSVNTKVFRPVDAITKRRLKLKLKISGSKQLAVYTGRLETTKGLASLLRAWTTIAASHPHAHLMLVGSGGLGSHNCEGPLRSYVASHDLSSAVTFTGSVTNVHEYLQAADVFVFPSLREAFGISVIEAMACELPVITTTPGGLADVVRDPKTAVIVPPDDDVALAQALQQVLDGDYGEMAAAGRAMVVQRFTEKLVLAQYRCLLEHATEPCTRPT